MLLACCMHGTQGASYRIEESVYIAPLIPANTRHGSDARKSGQPGKRWISIEPASDPYPVFAGIAGKTCGVDPMLH